MSTQLKVPYTKSCSLTDGPPIDDYYSGSQKIIELYVSSDMTAMVTVVGPDRCLTMHVSVLLEKLGGDVSTVLMNSSNTELAPAIASPVILAMCPFLASCRNIPSFTVKGLELNISHTKNTGITDTHAYLDGLPRRYPLGYRQAWIEEDVFEMGFPDKFKHEFGDKAGQWLNMVVQAFLSSSGVQKVNSKLETKDSPACHFGT